MKNIVNMRFDFIFQSCYVKWPFECDKSHVDETGLSVRTPKMRIVLSIGVCVCVSDGKLLLRIVYLDTSKSHQHESWQREKSACSLIKEPYWVFSHSKCSRTIRLAKLTLKDLRECWEENRSLQDVSVGIPTYANGFPRDERQCSASTSRKKVVRHAEKEITFTLPSLVHR